MTNGFTPGAERLDLDLPEAGSAGGLRGPPFAEPEHHVSADSMPAARRARRRRRHRDRTEAVSLEHAIIEGRFPKQAATGGQRAAAPGYPSMRYACGFETPPGTTNRHRIVCRQPHRCRRRASSRLLSTLVETPRWPIRPADSAPTRLQQGASDDAALLAPTNPAIRGTDTRVAQINGYARRSPVLTRWRTVSGNENLALCCAARA